MKKTALVLMILEVLSELFGFVKYVTLGHYYGISYISDAYLISLTIPLTLSEFIGTGISTTFIPIFSKMLSYSDKDDQTRYVNNLLNVLFLISTTLILISVVSAPMLVRIFASGFSGETFNLTVKLTRISAIGIYFSVLMSVLKGFLYSHKSFFIPQIIGIPFNLIIIISIIVSINANIILLSLGTLLAMFSQFTLITCFCYKKGFRHSFYINLKDKNLYKMLNLSIPTIIGTSVREINKLVDRTIASQIIVGGISALNYASRLNQFVQHIFVLSIVTILYPTIAKMAAEKNMYKFRESISEAIRCIYIIIIPATIGAMIFSKPIVKLLFGRGSFDIQAVSLTSYALFFYSLGMISYATTEVLSRAFYSIEDTRTPMINAAITMIINVILNIILSKFLGVGGLAFATSISAIIYAYLLFVNFRKKLGTLDMKSIRSSFLKVLCASLIMGAIAKLAYQMLLNKISASLSLVFAVAAGAVVYFIIVSFMRIDDVELVINALKGKHKRFLHTYK